MRTINSKLEQFKETLRGKRVAVVGLGVSNTPLIKYIARLGADVTVFDIGDETKLSRYISELKGLGVQFSLGPGYLGLLRGFDIIYKTPIVRHDTPELLAEKGRGAIVTSEMEAFMELCPAKMFGVTGSDGKTTTATIIYEILKTEGYKCWLGGNIGTPLFDKLDMIGEGDMVVLELSSFQLQTIRKSPDVAVITNLSPNHLDVHKSYGEYVESKKNIFLHQDSKSLCVLNYDCNDTRSLIPKAKGRLAVFSLKNGGMCQPVDGLDRGGMCPPVDGLNRGNTYPTLDGLGRGGMCPPVDELNRGNTYPTVDGLDRGGMCPPVDGLNRGNTYPTVDGLDRGGMCPPTRAMGTGYAYLIGGDIYYRSGATPDITHPAGSDAGGNSAIRDSATPNSSYNSGSTWIMNSADIKLMGSHNIANYLAAICAVKDFVNCQSIRKVATSFLGVEHRLEFVRTVGGISFYNDSIASSPSRTIACLNTFSSQIILIAGGKDKNLDYSCLGEYLLTKVKVLVLYGQTSEKIKNSLLLCIADDDTKTTSIPYPRIFECTDIHEAVNTAWENAVTGDTVVLSPASASFDMFRNFEERGHVFKSIVNGLQTCL